MPSRLSFIVRHVAALTVTCVLAAPVAAAGCDGLPGWAQRACTRLDQVWTQGDNELYLTGYAWHNRAAYSADRIRNLREQSWGGGLGRGLYDEDGDWHGLYGMAFLDSHGHVQPMAGYGFQKIGRFGANWRLGAGYTAFLTARQEILHYLPFPGILPLVSVGYDRATLFATYIPGRRGNGNVLFVFGKWNF
jgi:palmitoyl transferase